MSDYPMLISNKLHSFRNFDGTKYSDMAKVVHVHLTHGIDGTKRRDWYFSSISAVYTVLTAEQVGATKNYLLHAGLSGNGTVCTKRAIIKQSTLISGSRRGEVGE